MSDRDDQSLTSLGVMALLRRHALIVLVVAASAASVAYLVSDRQERRYSASSLVRIPESTVDQQILAVPPGTLDPQTQAATNVILVDTPQVSEATARRLGAGVASTEVEARVSVEAEGNTPIVRITATGGTPEAAARLATTYARAFARLQGDRAKMQIRQSRALLERQLARLTLERQLAGLTLEQQEVAQGQGISDRLLQLQLLESGDLTVPQVVETAREPLEAESPRPWRNGVLGGLFGLILGIGLAALRQQSDRRLRGQSDTEHAFGAPVIATVPRSSRIRRGSILGSRQGEPFRLLQANLRYRGDHAQGRSLVITSPGNGDGKTTTAWNLAAAAAAAGDRVLLVEADMRRPVLAGRLDLDPHTGLVQVLRGEIEADRAVQVAAISKGNGSAPLTVDVLVAGARARDVADLFQAKHTGDLISALKWAYDVVVIDTPAINEVSDAIPLAKVADQVLIVGRLGRTTREQARRTLNQLEALDVEPVGVVANRARSASFYDED